MTYTVTNRKELSKWMKRDERATGIAVTDEWYINRFAPHLLGEGIIEFAKESK